VFWEKNGLRHLEFGLPYLSDQKKEDVKDETNLEVRGLRWNKDSDILAVQVR
jgi:hypothetical protein